MNKMKQTSVYAALQLVMSAVGFRSSDRPIDGQAWTQEDQADWQSLAVSKLNVPPHIAHEVPNSVDVLRSFRSVIEDWDVLVDNAEEHAMSFEDESFIPSVDEEEPMAADDVSGDGDEGDADDDTEALKEAASHGVDMSDDLPLDEEPETTVVTFPEETSEPMAEVVPPTAEVVEMVEAVEAVEAVEEAPVVEEPVEEPVAEVVAEPSGEIEE